MRRTVPRRAGLVSLREESLLLAYSFMLFDTPRYPTKPPIVLCNNERSDLMRSYATHHPPSILPTADTSEPATGYSLFVLSLLPLPGFILPSIYIAISRRSLRFFLSPALHLFATLRLTNLLFFYSFLVYSLRPPPPPSRRDP